MNDLERKLRQQPFRALPPEWKAAILPQRLAEADDRRSSGRLEWLWPSPVAWGALAATWLILAALSSWPPGEGAPLPQMAAENYPPTSLFALQAHEYPEIFQ